MQFAYGGSWGSRLRFTAIPTCALTTPQKPECQGSTPVTTKNDAETGSHRSSTRARPIDARMSTMAAMIGVVPFKVTPHPFEEGEYQVACWIGLPMSVRPTQSAQLAARVKETISKRMRPPSCSRAWKRITPAR